MSCAGVSAGAKVTEVGTERAFILVARLFVSEHSAVSPQPPVPSLLPVSAHTSSLQLGLFLLSIRLFSV